MRSNKVIKKTNSTFVRSGPRPQDNDAGILYEDELLYYEVFDVVGGTGGSRPLPTAMMFDKSIQSAGHWVRRDLWWDEVGNPLSYTTYRPYIIEAYWRNPLPYQEVYDRAFDSLASKMRGSSELVVDAAEAGQSAAMLNNSRKLGVVFEDFLKRKTLIGASAKFASQKWLEYRYGWQPLVSSIYSGLDNVLRSETARQIPIRGRAVVTKQSRSLSGNGTHLDPTWTFQSMTSLRCELSGSFKLPSSSVADWTSLNPASIAWEMLPFSFVADWVIGVGDSLKRAENGWYLNSLFNGGHETITARETTYGNAYGRGSQGSTQTMAGATCVMIHKRRSQLYHLDMPTLTPQLSVNLNANRITDIGALMLQKARGRGW